MGMWNNLTNVICELRNAFLINNQGENMKLHVRLMLLGAVVTSAGVWADTGPYYVSYPGYCEVKQVYINARNDVYGKEISCISEVGAPLMGSFTDNGVVVVATVSNKIPCLAAYKPNGTLAIGCSAGGPVGYAPSATYVVRQSVSTETTVRNFVVDTEMPDLEKTKNLPVGGF